MPAGPVDSSLRKSWVLNEMQAWRKLRCSVPRLICAEDIVFLSFLQSPPMRIRWMARCLLEPVGRHDIAPEIELAALPGPKLTVTSSPKSAIGAPPAGPRQNRFWWAGKLPAISLVLMGAAAWLKKRRRTSPARAAGAFEPPCASLCVIASKVT